MRSVVGRLGVRGGRAIGLLLALALVGLLAPVAPAQIAPSGIDVSHYQGQIEWLSVASADIGFSYVKATEGTTITDDKGIARCPTYKPNSEEGRFNIKVTAESQGKMGTMVLSQSNTLAGGAAVGAGKKNKP